MGSQSASPAKRTLGIVWLTIFIDLVGFSIIFPIFPAMLEWYLPREGEGSLLHGLIAGLQQLTTGPDNQFLVTVLFGGILGSLYSLLQFFSSPLWGRLSDRHGRRRILVITTAGTALSYLIWIFSGAFWVLILSRVLAGVMAGNIGVATAAIADTTDSKSRSKGMALIGVAFGLGFILGPAIGGLGSLVHLGFDPQSTSAFALTPFSFPALLAFLLALGNILWVWKAFPETLAPKQRKSIEKRGPLFRFGSKNPNVKRALNVYFIFIFAFAGMEFTLTFLALERLMYEPHDMSIMFLFYTGLFFLGFGVGCASPSLSALVSLYSPAERQGAELGAFRSIGALGRALGPIFGAGLFWKLGSQTAYITGAVLLLVAALFSLFLPKPYK